MKLEGIALGTNLVTTSGDVVELLELVAADRQGLPVLPFEFGLGTSRQARPAVRARVEAGSVN